VAVVPIVAFAHRGPVPMVDVVAIVDVVNPAIIVMKRI
jgi:hypothetical protein